MGTEVIDKEALGRGDRRTLARAITLVESLLESDREQAQSLIQEVLPATGNSIRIGITGSPGVGKSTFIEAFGLHLLDQGRRVAVLAVDPSSPVSGGSILADKTRMERLGRDERAFIRPSPAGGALGGVAQRTRESMLLCEAAGFDVVLVETVGVGQSEHRVKEMVDFFLVLLLPGAGDELQGIKKGVIELADALIIHKADGDNLVLAEDTRMHYESALKLLRRDDFWQARVQLCSSLQGTGVQEVWKMVLAHHELGKAEGAIQRRRSMQNLAWMNAILFDLWQQQLSSRASFEEQQKELQAQVVAGQLTPYVAAKRLLEGLL